MTLSAPTSVLLSKWLRIPTSNLRAHILPITFSTPPTRHTNPLFFATLSASRLPSKFPNILYIEPSALNAFRHHCQNSITSSESTPCACIGFLISASILSTAKAFTKISTSVSGSSAVACSRDVTCCRSVFNATLFDLLSAPSSHILPQISDKETASAAANATPPYF